MSKRNRPPTPEAMFAALHWHERYDEYPGSELDFYNALMSVDQRYCLHAVKLILAAATERDK